MSSNYPELVFDEAEDFTADRLNMAMQVLDQRLRSLEPFTPSWEAAVNDLRLVGLSRLNDAILPAYQRIQLLSTLGFLFAGSTSEVTLTKNMTATFVIDDETERSLFTPTPFLALTRSSTIDDYAIAQLISYEASTGTLMVEVKAITGSPGPFTDWQIGACAANTIAAMAYFTEIDAARDAANVAKAATAADRVQTGLDRTQTGTDRNAAAQSAAAAATSATNAGNWDPTNYALKTYVDGKIQNLVGSSPAALDTLNELAAAINNDAGFAGTVTAALGNRVRVDVNNQGLDATQQANARTNIGAVAKSGDTMTGDLTIYRAGATNTAVIYLGSSGGRYLHYDGTNYNLNGAHLVTAAGRVWGTGDFNYRPVSSGGDTISGSLTVTVNLAVSGQITSASVYSSTLYSYGNVYAQGDIVYGYSDIRLKDDIQVIEDPLEKIDQIRGVTWTPSELVVAAGVASRKRRAGLLAQELLKVLPEAVEIAPFDLDENGESKSGEDYLNIRYDQVFGLLVEAIKALKAKVEKLEAV